MPEGDVVWYTASRLHEALAGRTLTRSDFRVPRLATADLTGDVVTETASRGKHLLTRTRNGPPLHTPLPRHAPAPQDQDGPDRPHPPADGRHLADPARGRAGQGQPPDQAAARQ